MLSSLLEIVPISFRMKLSRSSVGQLLRVVDILLSSPVCILIFVIEKVEFYCNVEVEENAGWSGRGRILMTDRQEEKRNTPCWWLISILGSSPNGAGTCGVVHKQLLRVQS